MGYGDEIMATGIARHRHPGKRVAFGDGNRIIWGPNSREIFLNNPNIVHPGDEGEAGVVWEKYYKRERQYFTRIRPHGGFDWNPAFRALPGEFYFSSHEIENAKIYKSGFVLIEPNVKAQYPNKKWPAERYADVASRLVDYGFPILQFRTGPEVLPDSQIVHAASFRKAAAILSRAALFIGGEGGLHHAARALDIPAVVIFGGFISPSITGYPEHKNFFTGNDYGCGNVDRCDHCRACMDRITVEEVTQAALEEIRD